VGDVKPYSNGENAKDPNKEDKSGLVYKGEKGLVYEPNVDEKSKETKTWPKTGVSEWVEKTRDLSVSDLARKLKEENGECSENIHELAKGLVEACKCNKKNALTFAREAKRGKILESLMNEIFKLPESYEILSRLIESESHSKKFDKMFNEMVAEPVGLDGEGNEGPDSEEDYEGDSEEGNEGSDSEEDYEGEEDSEEDHEDMEDMDDEEGEGDEEEHEDKEDEEGYEDIDGMGDEQGETGPMNNPFLPKEATWHYKGIHDAPEDARRRMTDMRGPYDGENDKDSGGKYYASLEAELKAAKQKVRDLELKMVRMLQMKG